MTLKPEELQAIAEQRAFHRYTRRPGSEAMESLLHTAHPVLDHGFVRVVDYMGDDAAIVQAARTSYGAGTRNVMSDTGLIRYLLRHWHTTPFEMCEIKLHMKMPMFVGEQTLRQRTASVNKESGRYSIMSNDKYVPAPERLGKQSALNKQGTGTAFDTIEAMAIAGKISFIHETIQQAYDSFVTADTDLARELARGILPANQYAEFYWKIDLHNLLNFLRQRLSDHAQYEIRVYAQVIEQIVKAWLPITYQAFVDYRLNARSFSGPELLALADLIDREKLQKLIESGDVLPGLTPRERTEFIQKIS